MYKISTLAIIIKLRLGALIPRSGLSVGLSDRQCLSSKNYKKNHKTLQNFAKRYKTFWKTVKEASAVCRSFLDGVVIFIFEGFHFFGHKMLQTHNFLDLKFSGSKFLLNSEFLWTQNHFLTQNYFDPKNVTPKEGFVQNTF